MSDLAGPVDPRRMRAADSDRERIVEILREAVAEGRLDLSELDERIGQAYAARTYGELEPLVADLPVAGAVPVPAVRPAVAGEPGALDSAVDRGGLQASTTAVAVMSGFERKGRWAVGSTFNAVAFWGGGLIDLREADFTAGHVRINAYAVMGGIEIIVPEHAHVDVSGIGVMGGFEGPRSSAASAAGGPTVVVAGLAFWGGVSVERKPSDEVIRQRRLERKRERELERLERKRERLERGRQREREQVERNREDDRAHWEHNRREPG
ncbi:DUF1707 SHOCT-like domain-containing protein [Melissospora conviva]|uniref:DUF1707 SHOCT-like domain-containing protein n=1 Tax=Melissospora conviva TaxID=3388432 RepID=UPI003B80D146